MTVHRTDRVDPDLVRAVWAASIPEQRTPELPPALVEHHARWLPSDDDAPCDADCACWDFGGDGPCTPEWDRIVADLTTPTEPAASEEPGWAVPGVTWDAEPTPTALPGVSPQLARLLTAVEAVCALDPAALPDPQALVDAEALQEVVQRLRVAQLDWTSQVDARELHRLRGLRTMTGWLRSHAPDAIPADRKLAGRLVELPLLAAAVTTGRVSLAAAAQVGTALGRVERYLDRPDGLIDGQPGEEVVTQILHNTLDLVCQAQGGLADDNPLLTQLEGDLADLTDLAGAAGAAGQGGSMLARVCGAFTLLGQHLGAGTTLQGALDQQVEAVLPNLLEQQQTAAEQRRGRAGVSELLCKGVTSTMSRRCGSERTRHDRSARHCRDGQAAARQGRAADVRPGGRGPADR